MNRIVLALVVVAACKGKSGPDLTPATFGSKPVPPGRLAKIKPGMTQAEVKALYPDNRPTPNHSGSPSLTIDSDFGNAEYRIGFYSDIDAVASVDVEVPGDMKITEELKKAWGKPASELGGNATWKNDDDGYEAEIWDMHRTSRVQFKPFTPLTAEFFGKTPGPVAELAKIKFGMTWDEVKAAVPGLEGPKGGNGSFIPFKAKADNVTLEVRYSDNKVDTMAMRMPARGVALLAKAWGPPMVGKARGTGDVMHCWDAPDKSMRVELTPGGENVDVSFEQPGRGFCELPDQPAK
jgi:hypothetical protein